MARSAAASARRQEERETDERLLRVLGAPSYVGDLLEACGFPRS